MDSTHIPSMQTDVFGFYGCFFSREEVQRLQHTILDKGQDEINLLRVVLSRLLMILEQKKETLGVNDTIKLYMMILRCAAALGGLLRMNAALSGSKGDEALQRLFEAFEEQDEDD